MRAELKRISPRDQYLPCGTELSHPTVYNTAKDGCNHRYPAIIVGLEPAVDVISQG